MRFAPYVFAATVALASSSASALEQPAGVAGRDFTISSDGNGGVSCPSLTCADGSKPDSKCNCGGAISSGGATLVRASGGVTSTLTGAEVTSFLSASRASASAAAASGTAAGAASATAAATSAASASSSGTSTASAASVTRTPDAAAGVKPAAGMAALFAGAAVYLL